MTTATNKDHPQNTDIDNVDITGPCDVNIRIRNDGKVVWLTIGGDKEHESFNFRACRIRSLTINDDRKP
jgi:hypothetical protein